MATTAIGIRAARELDELYRAHAAEVFRYAYAVLGNRADAEDVTQTTFVNALRALERGEEPRRPTNWLITIAHNLIRQRFRRQQARPHEVELDSDVPAAEIQDEDTSIDDLVRALQRIPPTQRQALVLRELEGRTYEEIGSLLGVSQSALEALIFRARRSLAEELENLVTCDRAELALSRSTDGRLGRKERRRLLAHLDECQSCARVAARSMKNRRAFKALAVLPLPFSLTLFKGAPSAYAAGSLPTIGAGTAAGTAAGVGAAGVSAKIAVGLAAVAVAGGAGYEGVQAVREPAAPKRPAKTVSAKVVPVARPVSSNSELPRLVKAKTTPKLKATTRLKPKPAAAKQPRSKPAAAASHVRGSSSTAPGQTKTRAKPVKEPAPKAKAKANVSTGPKSTATRGRPTVTPVRGKSASAPGRLRPVEPEKSKKPR